MATLTVTPRSSLFQPAEATLYESALRVLALRDAMDILERAYSEVLREHAPEYITTDVKAVLAAETLHSAWKYLYPDRDGQ